jgi:bifunctional non-homologous end joining protein LigD
VLYLPIEPMEPVSQAVVPEGPVYIHQVKWDGVRIIAHVGRESVKLHNRKLRERTEHYPEMSRLKDVVKGDAILDGEMVALKNGKPNFPLILERDLLDAASNSASRIKYAAAKVAVFYMIFDIVYHNGENLTTRPLRERQELLYEIVREDSGIQLVESFIDGAALFAAIATKKMEGIVTKEKDSRYFPGRKNQAWLKIKVRQQQLVVIGGYTVKQGQINALLAGVYHQGKLLYAGRVATGMSNRDWSDISPFLQNSQRATPPFIGASPSKEKVWVEPALVALIEFQEWTEDLRMRQPVIKGFTRDKPEDCVLE